MESRLARRGGRRFGNSIPGVLVLLLAAAGSARADILYSIPLGAPLPGLTPG